MMTTPHLAGTILILAVPVVFIALLVWAAGWRDTLAILGWSLLLFVAIVVALALLSGDIP